MIRTRRLSAGIGERTIVHPLSFRVPAGKTMAIIGPGGSGKSVLLRALAGASSGGLWTKGQLQVPVLPLPILPQKTAFRGAPPAPFVYSALRVAHLVDVLGMAGDAHLLDEPEAGTSGEDHDRIVDELRRARGRRTLILTTHHLDLVREVSDLVLLLIDGIAIEGGETARVFAAPSNIRTKRYLRMGS